MGVVIGVVVMVCSPVYAFWRLLLSVYIFFGSPLYISISLFSSFLPYVKSSLLVVVEGRGWSGGEVEGDNVEWCPSHFEEPNDIVFFIFTGVLQISFLCLKYLSRGKKKYYLMVSMLCPIDEGYLNEIQHKSQKPILTLTMIILKSEQENPNTHRTITTHTTHNMMTLLLTY